MRKLGKEFYEYLSGNERVLWDRNVESNVDRDLKTILLYSDYASFHDFIIQSFVWGATPQGHLYWSEISNREVSTTPRFKLTKHAMT